MTEAAAAKKAPKPAAEKTPPPPVVGPVSGLEKLIQSGGFAVTAELGPPKGLDLEAIHKKVGILKGWVDAANVTDNQTAVVRVSSIATAAIMVQQGLEPVMQMVARDRNRIAIQSDMLGATALGIRNVLCLSGDHQTFGSEPGAANVYDVDSIQMLGILKGMRDDAKFAGGTDVEGGRPPLFLGAAWSPDADPAEVRTLRLAKKVRAGAQFVQTQCIFDLAQFKLEMKKAGDMGLLDKLAVLPGIIPLKSAGMAKFMRKNVAGISIPEDVVKRMEGNKDGKEEGTKIAVETIQAVREIPGVRGVHIMAIEWESKVADIVSRAGLKKGPGA
ncbi:MAG: methylenetetrahydrofolate reductase [Deltaproteobacteria bacterium]|nr:methylenetetrahydrofolate reductase [Deltaproteobacteria bacterium]